LGATVGEQRLDRGADGATGEEDVVDDHDSETGEVEVDVGGVQDGGVGSRGDVIAVEADVEVAEGNVGVEQLLEQDVQTLGEEGSAAVDPHQRGDGITGVALEDLVRDARQRPSDFLLVEDDLLVALHSFLPGLAGPGYRSKRNVSG